MKTNLTLLLFCLFSVTLSAQKVTQLNNQYNKLTYSGKTEVKSCFDTPWLQKGSHTLELIKCNTDISANEHCRYQLLLKNIPVRGMQITVHYNPRTDITEFILPRAIPFEQVIPSFSPRIAYHQALDISRQTVIADKYNALHASENGTEKGLLFAPADYNFAKPVWVLAYEIDVRTQSPALSKRLTINAETGTVIFEEERMCSFVPENANMCAHEHNSTTAASCSFVPGTAETRYHGTREIETTATSGGFILEDQTRGTGITTLNLNTGELFFDSDNIWDNANAAMDEVAGDAHWGSAATFDFYNDMLNYNGVDGNGRGIESHVHLADANAFWNGTNTLYGDGIPGGDLDMPFTYINVIGHEMTHAVTEFSSGLIYAGESGAMNESISDIMGVSVEQQTMGSVSWKIGEAVSSSGFYFRNMADPNELEMADTYDGNFWFDGAGVHTNSSIGNYWFYLLVTGETGTNDVGYNYQVDQLGWEKAYTIAHTTWVNYLTPSSTYLDCALFSIEVAEDLYGSCSNEVTQVRNAWAAVNVLATGSEQAIRASSSLVCTIPSTVSFNASGDVLNPVWDFGDGNTSTETDPDHVYTQNGSYTVTLSGNDCNNEPFTVIEPDLILVDTNSTSCDTIIMVNGGNNSSSECLGILVDDGGIDDNYNNGVNSVLVISAPEAIAYNINLDFFETESGFDFLGIEADNGNGFQTVQIFSGTATGETFQVQGTALRFSWNTDGSVTRPGFVVSWECLTPVVPTANFIVEDTLICNSLFQATDLSEGFPSSWTWLLDGQVVSMEQNPVIDVAEPGVYDLGLIACTSLGCDTLIRTDYLSYDTTLTICDLIVMEDEMDRIIDNCEGTIIDDGGQSNYSNNVFSVLTIAPPATGAFEITLDSFNTEGGFDELTIFVDNGNGFEFMEELDGNLGQGMTFTFTGSQLRFQWDTDGSVTRPGFVVSWVCLPPQPVVVDFTVSDSLTCSPIFNLQDLSSNIPETWTWLLDGAVVSMDQNPTINVGDPGSYEVGLIACNSVGCDTLLRPDYLIYDTTLAICDLIVMEDELDLTVTNCEGTIIDDGVNNNYSNNVLSTLTITPPDAGAFEITLDSFNTENGFDELSVFVDNGNGFELSVELEGVLQEGSSFIVVGSQIRFVWDTDGSVTRPGFIVSWNCVDAPLPVADFFSPDTITCSNVIRLVDQTANFPNSWNWLIDGVSVSTQQNPTIDLAAPGTYDVELIACNNEGCDTLTRLNYIIYDDTDPMCSFVVMTDGLNAFSSLCEGALVDDGGIDNDYSNNVEASLEVAAVDAIGYVIDFEFFNTESGFDDINLLADNGNGFEVVDNFSGEIAPNSITVNGTRIRFEWDADGSVVRPGFLISWTCINNNQPPIVSPMMITDDCSNTIEFRSNSPNANDVTWDFGDGNTGTGNTVSHTYTELGDHMVTGVATNNFGSIEFSMDVSIDFRVVAFEAPDTMMVNELVLVSVNTHDENELNSRRWEIDGVIVSFGQDYNLSFEEPGTYELTIFATDLEGCVSTHTETIFVQGTTSVENTELDYITLSPNPTQGEVTLFNLDQLSTSVHISVVNLMGQQLFESQTITSAATYPVNLGNFPAGVYFIKIRNDKQEYLVKKVIKQ